MLPFNLFNLCYLKTCLHTYLNLFQKNVAAKMVGRMNDL